jgi:hypothetical protein
MGGKNRNKSEKIDAKRQKINIKEKKASTPFTSWISIFSTIFPISSPNTISGKVPLVATPLESFKNRLEACGRPLLIILESRFRTDNLGDAGLELFTTLLE